MPCMNHPEVLDPLMRCSRCARDFCTNCLVELKGGRFCAGCKREQVKDVQSGVESTELPIAGIGIRFVAQFIDGLILGAICMPIVFVVVLKSGAAPGEPSPQQAGLQLIIQVGIMALYLAYEAIMLQWRGQTFGKMAVRIKVVTPEGLPIGAAQAWVRALVRMFTSCLDWLPAFFTQQKTALHDLAARTRVVRLNP